MRNRLWLVYVAIASVATLGYFATGHVSYVINVIGLSSPVMIVVALRIWRPEKRLPWVMFSLGMFTFILGDIVSYNYDKFHSIAPSLFPFDADGLTPFPGWADAFYAWMNLYTDAGYQPGSGYLEAGWIAFYVLFGAAALHPSMRELSEPVDDVETKLTRVRLLVLAGASLMAPVLIAYEGAKGESTDLPILIEATVLLFILVVIRMWGLVRRQQRYVRHEQALREAGMDLVTATNRDSIHAAAGRAVLALTGDDVSVRIFEQQEVPGELVVVAAPSGDGDAIGTSVRLSEFDAWKRERLQGRHAYQVTLRDDIADMLELPE